MKGIDLFHTHEWHPLAHIGVTNPFFALNAETILYTWVALGIIVILTFFARWAISYPESLSGHLVLLYIKSFMDMIHQSLNHFVYKYFAFITSLFTFILVCNCLILIPGFEEPTKNLNTTLALGLISFFYVQKEAIKAHGLSGYIQEYMKMPFTLFKYSTWTITSIAYVIFASISNTIIGILTFPLEALSKLATVISISFRLFGNIFGGSIISTMFKQAVSGSFILQLLGIGINLIIALFFGLFEGFIQAFVFAILSLTYLSMGIQKGNSEDHA